MFISFEGLDGGGKTTQIQRLQARLKAVGIDVVCTHEPGGTPVGDALRSILLDPRQHNLAQRTEALLYATSRAQLLHEVIVPSLCRGQIVLCDRFVDASIAYQGAGLELGTGSVKRLNEFATGGLEPDLTFLFDLPVEVSQARVKDGRSALAPDRIEQRSYEYFVRVREAFLQLAKDAKNRVVVLDATKPVDIVEQEIWQAVEKHLNQTHSSFTQLSGADDHHENGVGRSSR